MILWLWSEERRSKTISGKGESAGENAYMQTLPSCLFLFQQDPRVEFGLCSCSVDKWSKSTDTPVCIVTCTHQRIQNIFPVLCRRLRDLWDAHRYGKPYPVYSTSRFPKVSSFFSYNSLQSLFISSVASHISSFFSPFFWDAVVYPKCQVSTFPGPLLLFTCPLFL